VIVRSKLLKQTKAMSAPAAEEEEKDKRSSRSYIRIKGKTVYKYIQMPPRKEKPYEAPPPSRPRRANYERPPGVPMDPV
jgi:hypothetical protein